MCTWYPVLMSGVDPAYSNLYLMVILPLAMTAEVRHTQRRLLLISSVHNSSAGVVRLGVTVGPVLAPRAPPLRPSLPPSRPYSVNATTPATSSPASASPATSSRR